MEETQVTTEKLSDDIINEIAELQQKYQQNSLEMGDIVFEEKRVQLQVTEAKAQVEERRNKLVEQEQALLEKIKTKYGEGTVDLATGEFIKD